MNLLSIVGYTNFLLLIYIAYRIVKLGLKSRMNKLFVFLTIICSIWSLCYAFMYVTKDKNTLWILYRLASPAWCLSLSVLLHFCIYLVGKESYLLKYKWIYFLMYVPAFILLYRAFTSTVIAVDFVTSGGYGTYEVIDYKSIWFNLWTFWTLINSAVLIYLLYSYSKSSNNIRVKKQALIILFCYVLNLILAALSNIILVKFVKELPALGAHFSSVFAFGIYYAMTRYELMSLTPHIAADEIFSKMMDLMILVDRDFKILTLNKQTENLLKFEEKEMIGKNIDFFLTDMPHFLENVGIIDRGELKSIEFESRMYNKTCDEIPVRFFVSNVKDRADQILGYVIVIHDIRTTISLIREIGERITAEEKLKEAIKKAEEANRAKSEFLANISHEIRTPLNSILGFNEILRTKMNDQACMEYINAIKSGGETLLVLINDILDLSKIEAGYYEFKPAAVSIKGVLTEIKQVFEYKASKKGIELVLRIKEDIPEFLYTDSLRLRQILLNIIGNAIKFTEKGKVVIKCFTKSSASGGKDLHMQISDTGIGIYSSDKDEIYKPFYRSSVRDMSGYPGAGLGLSIAKKFAEIMEGALSFESRVGYGTTFSFVLKSIKKAENPDLLKDATPASKGLDFSENTVLIIGKGKKDRLVMKEALVSIGVRVIEHERLKEGLKELGNSKVKLIGMLANTNLDEGLYTLKYIRKSENLKRVPAIVFAPARDVSFYKTGNALDIVLKKPVKIETFIEEASRYLVPKPKKEEKAAVVLKPLYIKKIQPGSQKSVVGVLQNEYLQEWESITKSFNLNKIHDFAGALIKLGEESSVLELSIWARDLRKDAKTCDVKLISDRLSEFKDVIAYLSKNLK